MARKIAFLHYPPIYPGASAQELIAVLREFGVTEADLDDLVAETDTQTRVMGHSTYQLTDPEIVRRFDALAQN